MCGNIKNFVVKSLVLAATSTIILSCDKVSPTGILVGGTSTDDRVKMSVEYYKNHRNEELGGEVTSEDYSFLVGSDSHLTTDTCRMAEMLQNGLDHDDMFIAHLGDIADTKAEYYIKLDNTIETFKRKFINKYCIYDPIKDIYKLKEDTTQLITYDEIIFPFFAAVGNHDITHNGWALFSSIFHSSFFDYFIKIGGENVYDHIIFLDSANGTLGDYQTDLIDEGIFNTDKKIRHTFVFTHTNLFRPSSLQFSSTFPREELYYLLNKFVEWKTTIVFCGHVHAWDERTVGGVTYLTLESMSEKNSPDPGDYLVRVTCKKDGTVSYEKVHMNYTPNK